MDEQEEGREMPIPKTCAECWLFTGIQCDEDDPVYGVCDRDGEQVLAENVACDGALPKGDDEAGEQS